LLGQRPFHRAPNSGSVGLYYTLRKFIGSFTGYMVGRRDDSTFLSDAMFGNSLLLPNRDLAPAYQKFDFSGRYRVNAIVSLYTSIEKPLQPALPGGLRLSCRTIRHSQWPYTDHRGENWRK